MNLTKIMEFPSHIDGRNATVAVYPDRLEWTRPGKHTVVNVLLIILAVYTIGISLIWRAARPKWRGESQMLPVRAISGVSTRPGGPLTTAVLVSAGANIMTFNVRRDLAENVRMTLTSLTLGSHPAQATTA